MALSQVTAGPPRDPGLQAERTALAWHRTSLALAANALLSLRAGVASGQPLVLTLGGVMLGAAAAVAVMGARRRRSLLLGDLTLTAPPPAMTAAVAMAALAACLTGLAGVVAALR